VSENEYEKTIAILLIHTENNRYFKRKHCHRFFHRSSNVRRRPIMPINNPVGHITTAIIKNKACKISKMLFKRNIFLLISPNA